jgi:peptidoglycan hydrolase-like protein with peptidoglycan-binding domain
MARSIDKHVIVSGRGPIIYVALGLCFSVAIAYNALGRQSVRHPAPIPGFWLEEILDQPVGEDASAGLQRRDIDAAPPGVGEGLQLIVGIQRELAGLSLYDGAVDGLLGPQTRAAIARYQTANGLTVDGEASEDLLEHVRYSRRIREALDQRSDAAEPQVDRVHIIQTGLAELGYSPGPIDGVIGEQTREAIRQFERDRRMAVTGEPTEDLLRELSNVSGISSLTGTGANTRGDQV